MMYLINYQVFLTLCLIGIASGLLSYMLTVRAHHPFFGYLLEKIALQAVILCAMLFAVLYSLLNGTDAAIILYMFRVCCIVSAFVIIRTTITLLCVHAIFKRFARYVNDNTEHIGLSEFLIMFKRIYDTEMRSYKQVYRDIFFNLSYNLSSKINNS